MTKYFPVDILMALIKANFAVGRNNTSAPIKGGKLPHMITDWDTNSEQPLPSLEFKYQSRRDNIRNLNANFRYTKEEVRIIIRSAYLNECWNIGYHLMDDILIPESKNFTTLTGFSNMEYNFLEVLSSFDVNEFAEDRPYWRMDILVIMHKPKIHTLT